jgi:hypothetical protein
MGRQCHFYLSRTCCCVYIAPKVVLGCPRISTSEKCKSTNIKKGKMGSNLSFPQLSSSKLKEGISKTKSNNTKN